MIPYSWIYHGIPQFLDQSIQLVIRSSTILSCEICAGSGNLCGGVWSQGLEQRGTVREAPKRCTGNCTASEAVNGVYVLDGTLNGFPRLRKRAELKMLKMLKGQAGPNGQAGPSRAKRIRIDVARGDGSRWLKFTDEKWMISRRRVQRVGFWGNTSEMPCFAKTATLPHGLITRGVRGIRMAGHWGKLFQKLIRQTEATRNPFRVLGSSTPRTADWIVACLLPVDIDSART